MLSVFEKNLGRGKTRGSDETVGEKTLGRGEREGEETEGEFETGYYYYREEESS